MTHGTNNGTDFSREEFLLDLQAGDAQVRPYSEDDAAVTEFWQEPATPQPAPCPAYTPPQLSRRPLPTPPSDARFPVKVRVAAFDLDLAETASELASDHAPSMRVKRAVMGLSALAMFGVFVTMFIISSAREGKSSATPTQLPPSSAPPQTSSAEAPPADESAPRDGASALPPSAAALLGPDDGRP